MWAARRTLRTTLPPSTWCGGNMHARSLNAETGAARGCQVYIVHASPPLSNCCTCGSVQGRQARVRGTPFALMNGATARDAACVEVPAGVHLEGPVHVLYISTGALMRASL